MLGNASAQRNKDGCFDRYQMSCDTMPDEVDTSVNPEELCTRLSVEVFKTQAALLDIASHAELLNGINADTDFCHQIQQAYHKCFFCLDWGASEAWEVSGTCFNEAQWTKCGGRPTQEELLSSNEYPLFQTVGDIDRTCNQLETAYSFPEFLKDDWAGIPPTIELCTKKSHAKHLCGDCDGGCFDGPNGTPPTCQAKSRAKNESETYLPGEACWIMDRQVFYNWLPLEDILNISKHQEYLRLVPGNTTLCDEMQQAYSECYWCTGDEDRCFDENNPPSCDAPDEIDDTIDFHSTCLFLFSSLDRDLEAGSQDFYNVSTYRQLFVQG